MISKLLEEKEISSLEHLKLAVDTLIEKYGDLPIRSMCTDEYCVLQVYQEDVFNLIHAEFNNRQRIKI